MKLTKTEVWCGGCWPNRSLLNDDGRCPKCRWDFHEDGKWKAPTTYTYEDGNRTYVEVENVPWPRLMVSFSRLDPRKWFNGEG
jgi:hypothetical protein